MHGDDHALGLGIFQHGVEFRAEKSGYFIGKVIDIKKTVTPLAGNDVYLTIDRDLQVATYNILEQFLAGVLVSKIINVKEYEPDEHTKASNFMIAIGDVYYQLFNNSIIDI